jgi:hypothetical protein
MEASKKSLSTMYPKDSRDAKIQPISGIPFPNKTVSEQLAYNE